jgi:hypothetical protein
MSDRDQMRCEMSPTLAGDEEAAMHGLHAGGWSSAPQGVGKHTRETTRVSPDVVAWTVDRRADSYWSRPAPMSRPPADTVAPPSGFSVQTEAVAGHDARGALPRRRRRRGRLAFVLAGMAALVLGLGGGVAYAYFTSTGSGTGHATVGTLQPVLVESATVTPSSHLFPGGSGGLSVKLQNPNARTLTLVGVSAAGVGTTVMVTGGTKTCSASTGVSLSPTVASGLSDTLKASTSTTGITTLTIPTAVSMSTSSASACQTKSFHLKVAVTVHT